VSSSPPAVAILVDAVRLKDFERLASALDPAVRFRALAPGEAVDVGSATEAVSVFRKWFADKDDLELVESESEEVVDRIQFRYRLHLRRAGVPYVVEHRLCGDLERGRFATLDLLCSGFRPRGAAATAGSVHRFDAGDLGCGTGLPREFRTRLGQIPIGHQLEVVTRDAAAREDLPSLTRMLGHKVVAVDTRPDGEINIRVERVK
jgi:TusA-related sulfurtransferase